ncbi:MAG: hypothetical protein U1E27_07420, partial [Kiritimatiellia bacterium]|nr:hypothetical protein [Kiritimatiellia bacterium]
GAWDVLHFTNAFAAPFTVTLTRDAAAEMLRFERGDADIQLDLAGRSLLLTHSATGLLHQAHAGKTLSLTVNSSEPGGRMEFSALRATPLTSGTNILTFSGAHLQVTSSGGTNVANRWFDSGEGDIRFREGVTADVSNSIEFGNGSMTVNPAARWIVADSGTLFTHSGPSLWLGKRSDRNPILIVTNGGSFVGSAANHHINVVEGGGTVNQVNPNANGHLIVTGSGSYLETHRLTLGTLAGNLSGTGGGTALVEAGGHMKIRNVLQMGIGRTVAGTNALAYGSLTVRGSGSFAQIGARLTAGLAGNARVSVENGGVLQMGPWQDIVLGEGYASGYTNDQARGELEVTGAGSRVETRRMNAGIVGWGEVKVSDGAELKALGDSTAQVTLAPRSRLIVENAWVQSLALNATNASMDFALGTHAGSVPMVNLGTGSLVLSGQVELTLSVLPSASLSAGQTVQIISYGTRSGTFAGLADGARIAANGYEFTIHYGSGSVYLTVVPPQITAQPQINGPVEVGANVALSVTASGQGLNYQWYRKQGDAIVAIGGATHT